MSKTRSKTTDMGPAEKRGEAHSVPGHVHRYVRIGRFHAYADHSIGTTFRNLLTEQDQFMGSEGKSVERKSSLARLLPHRFLRVIRAARLLQQYLGRKRNPSEGDVLELPVEGDLALVRRSGAVKVLDRDRERVYTLMLDPHDVKKLERRYKLSVRASKHRFAPRVEEVALDQGYFAEEFLQGRHQTNFRGCFDGFRDTYLSLLVQFLLAEPSKPVDGPTYAASLREDVLDENGLFAQLSSANRERVRRRVDESCSVLSNMKFEVPLVFSHGDFFSGNIVLGARGVRALDWAHLGMRSPLHDLYYLVMNHCVRVMDPPELHHRFGGMLRTLRAELFLQSPAVFDQLDAALSQRPEWRHLFYLECIQVPLERCDRPDDRYVASMLQRVEWFDAFEREMMELPGQVDNVPPD